MENSTSSILLTANSIVFFSRPFFISIGIIGNILMFIVFYQSASLSKLSVSTYFLAMSLANLFINLTWLKFFFEALLNFYTASRSNFLCKSNTFSVYMVSSTASWFLVAPGLDRFLTIAYPTRFQFMQRARFPLYTVICITIYNSLFYSHLLFDAHLTEISNSTYSCVYSTTFLILSDLINGTILPFFIMIISTFGMIVVVYKSRLRMKKFQKPSKSNNKRVKNDLKFAASMIITNIVFLVTNAPVSFVDFFDSNSGFRTLFFLLFYSYFSIVFFLQLAVNNLVRNQFKDILRKMFSCFE